MFVLGENSPENQEKAMLNKLRVRNLNSEKKARVDKARADARAKILTTAVDTSAVNSTAVDTSVVNTTAVETTVVDTTAVETTVVETTECQDTVFSVHFLMSKPIKC